MDRPAKKADQLEFLAPLITVFSWLDVVAQMHF
jgi:hypothetical protein